MEETLKNVIDQYLARGFGTMNKNDFEVWIFHYLMQHQLQGKSNYDISVALKVPEQKVKRLRYESELKYPTTNDTDRRQMLFEAISHAKFRQVKGKDGQIMFALNDKMLRSYLENQLINDGRFYDSSFMSNIIVLSISDFLFVLGRILLTKNDWQKIINQAKKDLKEPQILPASIAELAGNTAKGFCETLLKNFMGKAADGLVDAVATTINQTL